MTKPLICYSLLLCAAAVPELLFASLGFRVAGSFVDFIAAAAMVVVVTKSLLPSYAQLRLLLAVGIGALHMSQPLLELTLIAAAVGVVGAGLLLAGVQRQLRWPQSILLTAAAHCVAQFSLYFSYVYFEAGVWAFAAFTLFVLASLLVLCANGSTTSATRSARFV